MRDGGHRVLFCPFYFLLHTKPIPTFHFLSDAFGILHIDLKPSSMFQCRDFVVHGKDNRPEVGTDLSWTNVGLRVREITEFLFSHTHTLGCYLHILVMPSV